MNNLNNYHKRKLSHFQYDGMLNFITFRTHDSIDEYIKKLNLSKIENKNKQYQIDKYLDNSQKGAYLYDTQIKIMKNILFMYDNIDYKLYSFAIMPNHIHILLLPKNSLSNIMKKLKGKSARLLNEHMNRSGKFWAREYYDKIIKDDIQFKNTMNYILNNPINLKDRINRVYNIFDENITD